jgi:asparagine synthase (glutamine-hydrolysing)
VSSFVGKYSLDGLFVGDDFPFQVRSLLRARGPDGGHLLAEDRILMRHYAFHTSPDSPFTEQPFLSGRNVAFQWDGRLDNREELSVVLGRSDKVCGDVEYISAAYDRWGDVFVQHIRGDYALCIWDRGKRKILLARDPIGTRPLYYATDKHYLYWSSEIGALVHLLGNSLEIDDAYVAGYLTSTEELDGSPYKTIKAVHPGGLALFSPEGASVSIFWSYSAIACGED